MAATNGWDGYIAPGYDFADFPAGSHVLDVGFGGGEEMRAVVGRGCKVVGIDTDEALAIRGRAAGLAVCRAAAEHLPFASGSFDGLMCKVVIPYTDEARAIAEIARVLRRGGIAHVAYHGLGYSYRYLFTEPNWKRRLYGARTIVNTQVYRFTGRRLPGFWGDTVYQAPASLRQSYPARGPRVGRGTSVPRFAGAPVFIYHTVRHSGHDGGPDHNRSGA